MKKTAMFAIGMAVGAAVTAAVLLNRDEGVSRVPAKVICPHQAREPQWTVHRPSITSEIVEHYLKERGPSGIVYIGIPSGLVEIVSKKLQTEFVVSRDDLIRTADDTYEYKGKPAATLAVRISACRDGIFDLVVDYYMGPEGAESGTVKAALIDGDVVLVFGAMEVS
jgi:hypothetical protein